MARFTQRGREQEMRTDVETDWIGSETTLTMGIYPAGAKILPHERSAT
jgi:hypothetical protein